ncbi:DNA-3-methyladenine glycosylase I [Candidatus Berkelbacteria bacterium]|nr:DNA-3-methyladenine glycosylase I [Candidatus Berkelbacteria bacterium]
MTKRCTWPGSNELMIKYHDEEWGVPCRDDQKLFEYMVLDTFQAGLSWRIVLNKREGFRRAFDNFDAQKIAGYSEEKIQELINDASIIRNKLKIRATVINAQKFLEIQKEFGSFSDYLWGFVGNKPIINSPEKDSDIGATSPESDALSIDMKKRGFKFCGSTICYAFMQGAGLVNDHVVGCFKK